MDDNELEICNMNDDELFQLLETIDYEKECGEIKLIEESICADRRFCKKCDTDDHIIEDHAGGIIICKGCGNVVDTIFDQTIEKKSYGDNCNNVVERCSGITSEFLPQTSLGTTIAAGPYNRIKKLQDWSVMPYKEKTLYTVLKIIQTKCKEGNILKCIEDDAKILYKNISESKHESGKSEGKVVIIRGKKREGVIAACVFYACKRKGKSKSPKEIAFLFNLTTKQLTAGCKKFKKSMKMRYMPYDSQIPKPEHYIADYCKILGMDKDVIGQANKISENIMKINVASMHTPLSVAIGSILVIMKKNGRPINKNHIAKKFKVSAVTVGKTQKQITKHELLLCNDKLVDMVASIVEKEKAKATVPVKFQLMYDKLF